LLIVILLFAIPMAWLAGRMRQKRLEREVVRELLRHGAQTVELKVRSEDLHGRAKPKSAVIIWFDGYLEDFFTDNTVLSIYGPITDEGFESVAALPYLKEVWIHNADLTAAGLLPLKDLHELTVVDIDRQRDETVTSLEFVDGAPGLRHLGLVSFQPNEIAWQRIKSLPNLKRLRLNLQSLGENGMRNLSEMRHLQKLDLNYCFDVEDADLKYLYHLKELECLNLHSAHVTAEGVKNLQSQLPNCEIW
jgi:hypothetical protein